MTDKQLKKLRERMFNLGRETLIERLENALVNKNLQGNEAGAARLAEQIEYVRRHSGWITQH